MSVVVRRAFAQYDSPMALRRHQRAFGLIGNACVIIASGLTALRVEGPAEVVAVCVGAIALVLLIFWLARPPS